MNIDEIKKRIKKLFALSSSPNQHEAESALTKANRLMAEYNIAQSEMFEADSEAEMFDAVSSEAICKSAVYRSFTQELAQAVAKFYDIEMYNVKEPKLGFCFVGFKADIEQAEVLFNYLFDTWMAVVRVDATTWRKSFSEEVTQFEMRKYRKAHGQGYSAAITRRVNALKELRKQQVITSTALVVHKTETIKDFMDAHTVRRPVRFKAYEHEGRHTGYVRGQQTKLNEEVN